MVQKRLLGELIKDISETELDRHYRWAYEKKTSGSRDIISCFVWYLKLIMANMKIGKYNRLKFARYVSRIFIQIAS